MDSIKYYNDRIGDFRKKVDRSIMLSKDKKYIYQLLKKLSGVVGYNCTSKQFNDMLGEVEKVYNSLQKDFVSKLNYLNSYFKQNKRFPYWDDKITMFKDGTVVSDFLLKNLNYLMQIYAKNKVLMEALNSFATSYKLGKKYSQNKLLFEYKVKFVYKYLVEYNCLPIEYDDGMTFPDGESISVWFKKNEQKLNKRLDYFSKAILSYYRYYNDEDFKVKLNYVYSYLIKNLELPSSQNNKIKFEDGTLVGSWIASHIDDIKQLKDALNEARVVDKYLDFVKINGVYNIRFYKQVIEAYKYLKKNLCLPVSDDSKVKFKNGTLMGRWLICNKEKLQFLNNDYAKEIVNYLEEHKKRVLCPFNKEIVFDEKKQIVYDFLVRNGKLPIATNKVVRFDDGTLMGSWITDHYNDLCALTDSDSQALAIINYLKSHKKYKPGRKKNALSFDEKITEAYKYLMENGSLPRYDDRTVMFSDTVFMGRWLRNNKRKIKEMIQDNRTITIIQYYDSLKLYKDESVKQKVAVFKGSLVNETENKAKKIK